MPSYTHLIFPVTVVVWILSLNFVQYSLVQHLAVCCCWTLLLAAVRICRFFSSGDDLFSAGTMHVTPMTGSHLGRLDLSQPCAFKDLFPKADRAVPCMARKVSHLSVAELPGFGASRSFRKTSANCSTKSSWRILLTLSLIFATPQGVVYVTVRVVERACVKDVLQVVMGDQPGSDPADAGVLKAFVFRRRWAEA